MGWKHQATPSLKGNAVGRCACVSKNRMPLLGMWLKFRLPAGECMEGSSGSQDTTLRFTTGSLQTADLFGLSAMISTLLKIGSSGVKI